MMEKTVRISKQFYTVLKNVSVQKRTFLSDAYRCQEAWDRRLASPLLQKIDPSNLFYEIGKKYSEAGKVSALDIDLFANTIVEDNYAEELVNILKGLRLTPETTNTLDSTHHAVIRYLLHNNNIEILLRILHDRYQYGIFPDHMMYNILMDTFIKKKDFASAAKVAVLLMLQEDSENVISNALCVYSCFKYLENPDDWQEPKVEEEPDDGEEIKVRVKYLRQPYFDDHFDLQNPLALVGKTLAFQGKVMNNSLGRSCQLRGLILYKKYEAACKLMEGWLTGKVKEVVYDEIFDLIEKDSTSIPTTEVTDQFKKLEPLLNSLKQTELCKGSLLKAIEEHVKSAVSVQANVDIDAQCQAYNQWENIRTTILQKQKEEMEKIAAEAKIAQIKKELEEKERLLTFFENEEAIELEIERLEAKEQEIINRLGDKLKKVEKESTDYISPTIGRKLT